MAVDELYRATDDLILPHPSKFYRAAVHAYHWQLRSLISAPHGDYVYYPSNSSINRINIQTCRRELVATLKFAPRCLSAAPGWICCGGEDGQFAVIRLIEDASETDDRHGTLAAAADSRLPLELDPIRRSTDSPIGGSTSPLDTKERSFIRISQIGAEIVNCVTFWFPPPKPSAELYNAPVAVLANNDHTVTVVDLKTSDEIQTITFTDCINRAVISPNGRLLITIGDDPFMYVYSRELATSRGQFSAAQKHKYEWKQASQIQLISQFLSDKADTKGSFAASFSKSGKYLAVGTQYGIISVFDTTSLADPESDPLITAFTTSRPKSKRGAVRDLEFSPEPYDLLTWTENNGRVGIADARDNFMSRQIICVDSRAQNISRVKLLDRDEVALVPNSDARYRTVTEILNQAAEAEAGRSDSPDLLSESIEHRRLRDELANDMLERLAPQGETASAFQVLQALQEHRRSREAMREAEEQRRARESENAAAERRRARDAFTNRGESELLAELTTRDSPANANASATMATMSGARPTSSTVAINRYRDLLVHGTSTSSGSLPSILREFTSADRSNASLRAYISERNQERERRGQQPRRRGSVIMDAAGRSLDREFRDLRTARTSQSEANSQDGLTRLPPRLPAIGSDSPSSPWAELESLYNITVDPPVDISARLRIETEDDQRGLVGDGQRGGIAEHARRMAERGLGQHRGVFARGSAFLQTAMNADPDETCGCCWSPDGRILFVATEDGIFEYHVNTIGRKFFPSLTLR